MQYTFVHISDIHYRQGWAEEVGVVSRSFFADLQEQIREVANPYLVVSGDLVAAGGDSAASDSFLADFSTQLTDAGIPVERRICVPGNHDVSRKEIQPTLAFRSGGLDNLKGETAFNNALDGLQANYLAGAFSAYVELERGFAKIGCCSQVLGGCGHAVEGGLSVFCLNTALTSCGGLPDANGKAVDDRGRLHIDTRTMHKWLEEPADFRVLVMHHPSNWLIDWAEGEVGNAMRKHFSLCFMGHTHMPSAQYSTRRLGGVVECVAPALFTRKNDDLGYAIVSVDTDKHRVSVRYRQWARSSEVFVAGTVFAGNDTGVLEFASNELAMDVALSRTLPVEGGTLEVLESEFEDSAACYSSKRCVWVPRDLSTTPEAAVARNKASLFSENELVSNLRSCFIRAPSQYGLSSLARRIALQHYRETSGEAVLLVVAARGLKPNERNLKRAISERCRVLKVSPDKVVGFIFDEWVGDKHSVRVVKALTDMFPAAVFVLMSRVEDCSGLGGSLKTDEALGYEVLYLWALDRARVRQLTELYIVDSPDLDEDRVVARLISDLEALNVHRTPMNCLLLLRCLEERFEDTPVNRTLMIEQVLFGLFHQFDQIPRYASRPDVKDCEFALGYLCEVLIREGRDTFSREFFVSIVQEFCRQRMLDMEVDVLFGLLVSANIVAPRGDDIAFRFSYWLYFFAAHRMRHDAEFAGWILADRRYAAFPELMEFYAGTDRHRSDAVAQLTTDLAAMNSEFLERTKIAAEFDPFQSARWEPGDDDLERMRTEVHEAVNDSALPAKVKEDIADKNYDPGRPYNQELAEFLEQSTLRQMTQGMRGGARALRNSDYVDPEDKSRLLDEVLTCWRNVCQVLAVISPALAKQRRAVFEDTQFYLADGFSQDSVEERWHEVMDAIAYNVVNWYGEDLFSKKMGRLLSEYVKSDESKLSRFLCLLVMIRRRPLGWAKTVKDFVLREDRHSFYMAQIYTTLRREFRNGFAGEADRQRLLSLSAIAVAKHELNVKDPNQKTIERMAKAIERGGAE